MDSRGQFIIVCSSAGDREIWAEVMKHRAARTIFVSTVAEIQAIARRQTPALVICEEQLPDGSYRDVLQALSKNKPPARLLILIQDAAKCSEIVHQGAFDAILLPLRRADAQWAVIRALTSSAAASG